MATFGQLTELNDSKFLHNAERVSANEYFLERSPIVFGSVHQFLTTGELHQPPHTCPHSFISELEFWGVGICDVQKCCQNSILMAIDERNTLNKFEQYTKNNNNLIYEKCKNMCSTRNMLWVILNEPGYSKLSKVYAVIAGIFVLMSIFVLTAQTHPVFQRKLNVDEWQDYLGDDFGQEDIEAFIDNELYYYDNIADDTPQSQNKTRFHRPFTTVQYLAIIDYVATAFFTLDLMIRFLVCPYKLKFIFDFFNLMDLIALVAVFVHVTIEGILTKERYRASLLDLVLAFQVLRILRFLRMIKRVRGFRVLVYAMRVGFRELMTVAMFVFLAVISFGCIIYFLDNKTRIKHIPDGIYWALITVTTVGYGDIVPGTPQGKFVACICALLGVLLTAVTVPVFVNNFVLYYSHASVLSLQEDIEKNNVQPNGHVIVVKSLPNKNPAYNKTYPVSD
ncbi:hypothetical protein SNE40_013523 [Patella caerulea]